MAMMKMIMMKTIMMMMAMIKYNLTVGQTTFIYVILGTVVLLTDGIMGYVMAALN